MGCARRSVAVAVLVMMMMMVGTSHSLMSNMSTSAATTAGNSTAASSAWCDGHMIDGQCMLIAHAYGGEHSEYLNVDVMDMMEEGQSTRRVLVNPITFVTPKTGNRAKPVVEGDGRYGSPNQAKGKRCAIYKRTYCD